MKHKVGDKVKIKENLIVGKTYGGLYLHDGAGRHIGEETIVTKVERDRYRLAVDNSSRIWTEEMLEQVEELTAEEAIRILGGMCRDLSCCECPIYELIEDEGNCDNLRAEKPDKVIEVLKQWKKDHEKKEVEVEFVWYAVIKDEKGSIVHEKRIESPLGSNKEYLEKNKEILAKYCSEHNGKFYGLTERRCVVKE